MHCGTAISINAMLQDENKLWRRRCGAYHCFSFETRNRCQTTSPNSFDGFSNKRPPTGSPASCASQRADRQGMDKNAGLLYRSSCCLWEIRVDGGLRGWGILQIKIHQSGFTSIFWIFDARVQELGHKPSLGIKAWGLTIRFWTICWHECVGTRLQSAFNFTSIMKLLADLRSGVIPRSLRQ